jgi:hypothetical protein
MTFSLFSLQVIWNFISPVVQDLLKEGGKKLLAFPKTASNRESFYELYTTLGGFRDSLSQFIEELSKFLDQAEQKMAKSRRLSETDRARLDRAGVSLSKSLKKLYASLKKVDPEIDIYANEVRKLLETTYYSEWETLNQINRELLRLRNIDTPVQYSSVYYGPGPFAERQPIIESIDTSQLREQLKNAQINLELSARSIQELRDFIKNNIPLKAE